MTKKLEQSERQREEIKNLKKGKTINKKIGGQWEAETRFGGAATNKNGASPQQLEPTYRADGAAMWGG